MPCQCAGLRARKHSRRTCARRTLAGYLEIHRAPVRGGEFRASPRARLWNDHHHHLWGFWFWWGRAFVPTQGATTTVTTTEATPENAGLTTGGTFNSWVLNCPVRPWPAPIPPSLPPSLPPQRFEGSLNTSSASGGVGRILAPARPGMAVGRGGCRARFGTRGILSRHRGPGPDAPAHTQTRVGGNAEPKKKAQTLTVASEHRRRPRSRSKASSLTSRSQT